MLEKDALLDMVTFDDVWEDYVKRTQANSRKLRHGEQINTEPFYSPCDFVRDSVRKDGVLKTVVKHIGFIRRAMFRGVFYMFISYYAYVYVRVWVEVLATSFARYDEQPEFLFSGLISGFVLYFMISAKMKR